MLALQPTSVASVIANFRNWFPHTAAGCVERTIVTMAAPYIMPDGRTLTAVLRIEGFGNSDKISGNRKTRRTRAKDELWGQLQHSKGHTMSDQELAEMRAMERVGHRRRRQWLNDKLLRDLAGPMSMHDMEAQFKPIPFGVVQPPSAFTVAAAPQHAALWDLFRNIDSDKEARVLQAWEEHVRRQQQQHGASSSVSDGTLQHHQPAGLTTTAAATAAAAALAKWSRVERRCRAALKKASLHAVWDLELQALQLVQQEDPSAAVRLELPDSFARLLVHGLAQFHSLQSITQVEDGKKAVLLRSKHTTTDRSTSSSSGAGSLTAVVHSKHDRQADITEYQQQQHTPYKVIQVNKASDGEGPAAAAAAVSPGASLSVCAGTLHPPHPTLEELDLLCSDVVAALRKAGGHLDHVALSTYASSLAE